MAKTRESSSPTTPKLSNGNGTHPRPTHEQIAERAYQLYMERGDTPGDELSDWVRAEQELSAMRRSAEKSVEKVVAEKTAKPRKKASTKAAGA